MGRGRGERIGIVQFHRNAQAEGICADFDERWKKSHTKKELIDMALDVKGADYLCDAIAKGWGIDSIELKKNFEQFINGVYKPRMKGYTSEMYCCYKGAILAETTLITVIDSNITINIPRYHICEIFATGKCKLEIKGEGQCTVVAYGDYDNVLIDADTQVRCKRIQKKERD